MIKYIIIIKRPPNMTIDDLRRWWLGSHATIAKRIPGLIKYVISPSVITSNEEPEYDGIAELWFNSIDDLNKARASSLMVETGNDLKEHEIAVVARLTTEEHVII